MKFCTDIQGSQTVKPNNVGDTLTFPLVLPQGSHLWFQVKCPNNY